MIKPCKMQNRPQFFPSLPPNNPIAPHQWLNIQTIRLLDRNFCPPDRDICQIARKVVSTGRRTGGNIVANN
jgi:hypothetical protein